MSSRKYPSAEGSDKSALGARIRIARGSRGQEWLAGVLGVSASRVSEWEGGKKEPRASTLVRIAEATGCNLAWLLRGDEAPPPLGLAEPRPGYGSPELAELVAGIQEILDSGVEVVIRALRANIEAFRLSARELREKKGAGVRRERKEGPSGRSGSGQGGD